jgi:hypothetical protein
MCQQSTVGLWHRAKSPDRNSMVVVLGGFMRFGKGFVGLGLILFCLSVMSSAQNWTGVLDPGRAIDWSNVGIPGGIPTTRTQCGATVQASTYGNGSSDASAGITSLLNACSANTFLLLGPGTFRVNSSIAVPSSRTLRGSGAQQTIMDLHNTSGLSIGAGGWWQGSTPGTTLVSITGGGTRGSSSLTLSSASGISVGSYLEITELNDSAFVDINGGGGACTWCGVDFGSERTRGQISEVTSVNGTTVGITPPLFSDFTHTPAVTPFTASAKWVGIENLQIVSNNNIGSYAGDNMGFTMCAYCWIKGVASHGTSINNDHVDLFYSYRNEVRDSYFLNCSTHSPGNADCDIFMGAKTTGTLVENNIIERTHAAIEMDWGAAGNVIGYNYMTGSYGVGGGADNFNFPDIVQHGAHPQWNLWEGNVAGQMQSDAYWGTGSHVTMFRNWSTGVKQVCPPQVNGNAAFNCTSTTNLTEGNRAFDIGGVIDGTVKGNFYHNLVGNVGGSASTPNDTYIGGGDSCPACVVSPGNRSYSGTAYDYGFGYKTSGDSSGVCSSRAACTTYTTAFLHGNYSYAGRNTNAGIQGWANGATQTLPPSFYKSAKPAWWRNPTYTIPWPAIGPDVTGGTGPGGHASLTASNPAQACYNSTPKASDGSLAFDPSVCYGGAIPITAPAKPTVNSCNICTGSNCSPAGCTIQ